MMKTGQAKINQIFLDNSAEIDCSPDLIPAAGQYILAHKPASDSPLAVPLFPASTSPSTGSGQRPSGFRCAPPIPADWKPSDILNIRGVLGHGFSIPISAKKIALIACEESFSRLQALIPIALKQNAEIVLLSDNKEIDLPEIIEIQPMQSLTEILTWADYVAIDIARQNLNQLKEKLGKQNQAQNKYEAQILIHTAMPCGSVAECGVCALSLSHAWKMICKDGPVFNLDVVARA
jgi:hypothetical protein